MCVDGLFADPPSCRSTGVTSMINYIMEQVQGWPNWPAADIAENADGDPAEAAAAAANGNVENNGASPAPITDQEANVANVAGCGSQLWFIS